MGRYPLKETIGRYMESNRSFLAETTFIERGRKLRAFAEQYDEMHGRDATLEADPAKWTEREMGAIILDMRKRHLGLGTQKKQLGHINAVLKFVGNGVMSKMKVQTPHAFPRGQYVRGPSLTAGQLDALFDAVEKVTGWHGEVVRFVMAGYAYTGLRMSELRRAQFADLDLRGWTLRVRHPKGEGSYGEYRVVPLPGPLKPCVERFVRTRESMLAGKGELVAEPLIPRQRGDGYYSANHFEQIAMEVRALSGVDFDFRSLRRTYGQNLLNRGVQLSTVSLMLGHASTLTTEKYYCRKDADSARLEVVRAFEESAPGPKFNPPLIDKKPGLTGYV